MLVNKYFGYAGQGTSIQDPDDRKKVLKNRMTGNDDRL
jgi:hypothetical protein